MLKVEQAFTIYPDRSKVVAIRRQDNKELLYCGDLMGCARHKDWFNWDISSIVMLPYDQHIDWTIEAVGLADFLK